MKKLITTLLVITSFVLLLIKVGSTIVNSIAGLLPESAHDWLPIIKILLWFVTFSFDLIVTYFLYIIIVFIIVFISKILK